MVSGPLVDAASRPISLPAARQRGALSVRWDGFEAITRRIAEETPVAIIYNKLPYAVMMATPADLEDFGTGFSITERIVSHPRQITGISVQATSLGVELRIAIDKSSFRDELATRRGNVTGRTGCGLCGIRKLEDAVPQLPPVPAGKRVHASAIRAALNDLASCQSLNAETHAVHAAAWAASDGRLLTIREDVGRHNALDKLVGSMAAGGVDPQAGFCVITSRCSYEMVQKAALAGISVIVAISAPTELAIRQAEAAGLTLVALARSDGFAIHAHPGRIIIPSVSRPVAIPTS
jgi:formate dehydrogenase accessory protein FdhD